MGWKGRRGRLELSPGPARQPAVGRTVCRRARQGRGTARQGDRREGWTRKAARAENDCRQANVDHADAARGCDGKTANHPIPRPVPDRDRDAERHDGPGLGRQTGVDDRCARSARCARAARPRIPGSAAARSDRAAAGGESGQADGAAVAGDDRQGGPGCRADRAVGDRPQPDCPRGRSHPVADSQAIVPRGPAGRRRRGAFSDYRPVDGIQIAFRASRKAGPLAVDRRVTEVKINTAVDAALFSRPSS